MKRLSALFWIFSLIPLAADSKEFVMMIRESQKYLARAQPLPAEAGLKEWELNHPDAHTNATFCYQRFFVALEGRGDRRTARRMLRHLDRLVAKGQLAPDSVEYLSVTEAWQRALFSNDSDLPRLAYRKMSARLSRNTP